MHLINNKPLIQYVIDSVKKSKKVKKIIIATSNRKTDNKLVNYLHKKNNSYYRGDLQNVANRLLRVATINKSIYFMRISGDSPLIDYKIINKSINILKDTKKKYDIITNVYPRTFPKGQSVEIIKTQTLAKNINYFSKNEKEHVTNYFYKNANKFLIKNFKSHEKKKNIKLSIDTKTDLKKIKKILNNSI